MGDAEFNEIVSDINLIKWIDYTIIPNVMIIKFNKTCIKSLTVKLQCLDDYPLSLIHIEASSNTLPNKLVDKLKKQCLIDIKQEEKQMKQIMNAYLFFKNAFEDNMFLSCFNEIIEIKQLFNSKTNKQTTLKLNPKNGSIKLKLIEGEYKAVCMFQIFDEYPRESVVFEIKQSNFPNEMTQSVLALGSNLVMKLSQGYDPEIKANINNDDNETKNNIENISKEVVYNIKNDVKYLQKSADLREMSDDKQMRRNLRRMNKKEAQLIDNELQAKMDYEEELRQRAFKLKLHENALPHLYRLMKLVNKNLCEMAIVNCGICNNRLLSKSVDKQKNMKRNHAKYPLLSTCGHWFHYKCLDKHLTTPPFVKKCPDCNKRITNNKWTTNVKALERTYTQKKAKERELGEVGDFLGL